MWRTFIDGSRPSAPYCVFKYLKGQRAAIPTTSQLHEAKMAVAALERSFIEICGFERETLHRFREVTVDQGKPFLFFPSHTHQSSVAAGDGKRRHRAAEASALLARRSEH